MLYSSAIDQRDIGDLTLKIKTVKSTSNSIGDAVGSIESVLNETALVKEPYKDGNGTDYGYKLVKGDNRDYTLKLHIKDQSHTDGVMTGTITGGDIYLGSTKVDTLASSDVTALNKAFQIYHEAYHIRHPGGYTGYKTDAYNKAREAQALIPSQLHGEDKTWNWRLNQNSVIELFEPWYPPKSDSDNLSDTITATVCRPNGDLNHFVGWLLNKEYHPYADGTSNHKYEDKTNLRFVSDMTDLFVAGTDTTEPAQLITEAKILDWFKSSGQTLTITGPNGNVVFTSVVNPPTSEDATGNYAGIVAYGDHTVQITSKGYEEFSDTQLVHDISFDSGNDDENDDVYTGNFSETINSIIQAAPGTGAEVVSIEATTGSAYQNVKTGEVTIYRDDISTSGSDHPQWVQTEFTLNRYYSRKATTTDYWGDPDTGSKVETLGGQVHYLVTTTLPLNSTLILPQYPQFRLEGGTGFTTTGVSNGGAVTSGDDTWRKIDLTRYFARRIKTKDYWGDSTKGAAGAITMIGGDTEYITNASIAHTSKRWNSCRQEYNGSKNVTYPQFTMLTGDDYRYTSGGLSKNTRTNSSDGGTWWTYDSASKIANTVILNRYFDRGHI